MARSWHRWFDDRVTDRRCMPAHPCGFDTSRGIETQSAKTERLGPKDESPSGATGAPDPGSMTHQHNNWRQA